MPSILTSSTNQVRDEHNKSIERLSKEQLRLNAFTTHKKIVAMEIVETFKRLIANIFRFHCNTWNEKGENRDNDVGSDGTVVRISLFNYESHDKGSHIMSMIESKISKLRITHHLRCQSHLASSFLIVVCWHSLASLTLAVPTLFCLCLSASVTTISLFASFRVHCECAITRRRACLHFITAHVLIFSTLFRSCHHKSRVVCQCKLSLLSRVCFNTVSFCFSVCNIEDFITQIIYSTVFWSG